MVSNTEKSSRFYADCTENWGASTIHCSFIDKFPYIPGKKTESFREYTGFFFLLKNSKLYWRPKSPYNHHKIVQFFFPQGSLCIFFLLEK